MEEERSTPALSGGRSTTRNAKRSPASAPQRHRRCTTRGSRRRSTGRTKTPTVALFPRKAQSDASTAQVARAHSNQRRRRTKPAVRALRDRSDGLGTRRPAFGSRGRVGNLPTRAQRGPHPWPLDRGRRDVGPLCGLSKGRHSAKPRGDFGSLTRRTKGNRSDVSIHLAGTRPRDATRRPEKYVPRFCSELELSEEVQTKANEIIEKTAEEGLLSGKSPTGYAAAAIYAASLLCNEKKTQREVADVAQVTEVTIRNRYQEQIEAMGIHG